MKRKTLRDLGIVTGRLPPGPRNAITDVTGVRVGHVTLIHGEGPLVPGQGPVRTGVTAIWPHAGDPFREKAKAAAYVINGFGKAVGLHQVVELGNLETPILLTGTLNVGLAADALVQYMVARNPEIGVSTGTVNPVVGECSDAWLNDIQGRHVRCQHVFQALDVASEDEVLGGSVGGGTGMIAFGFKAGIGSASRTVTIGGLDFLLGVLAQVNFGRRDDLLVLGVPVGRLLGRASEPTGEPPTGGSVVVVVATDAPLDSRQLGRLARRAVVGLARTGGYAFHGSGDFAIAFSTANREPHRPSEVCWPEVRLPDHVPGFDLLLRAAAEATEEAVYNALALADAMTGRDGHHAPAFPLEEVADLLDREGWGR